MTDINVDELIAEAQAWADSAQNQHGRGTLVEQLADALEQVTEAGDANAYAARTLRQRVHELAAERDRLAGVIEKVREVLPWWESTDRPHTDGGMLATQILAILDAPSDPTPAERSA